MRELIRETTSDIEAPSAEARAEAMEAWGSRATHDRFMAEWPCLRTVEVADPPVPTETPSRLRVAAWNMERCKHVVDSARLISAAEADVVLATEMDRGMARSRQRHTARDVAAELYMGYAFGVEFVELGAGDARETAIFAKLPNRDGLHGNAILSRWPLEDVVLIPLDEGGEWFVRAPKDDGQYRVGGRMALAARIRTAAGPLTLVSVHYESESDAAGRATQTRRMLDTLDALFPGAPAVIGGDLNTKGFLEAGVGGAEMLRSPKPVEPSFTAFAAHGFDWQDSNTGQVTTRNPPGASGPLKTLDWLFVRGVTARTPFVRPALSEAGAYLSDHDLIGCTVVP